MKITLEPRKTTWVPFINGKARLEIEWTAKIEYSEYSLTSNTTHTVNMRYVFSSLEGVQFVPSSQLIIKEQGIPLTITQTVVSPAKDRFKSESIDDPFVEIQDRVSGIDKSKVTEKKLSKRMIERKWHETITRSVKIENKTGKKVRLKITVVDKPAQSIVFVSAQPNPTHHEPPDYFFDIELDIDQINWLKLVFKWHKFEKLELPPDHVKLRQSPEKNILLPSLEQTNYNEIAQECVEEEECEDYPQYDVDDLTQDDEEA